ncbi:hypothetical protein J6590_065386 [Homalodisca vitripennis]|nr:hypothetical protein J6590_065386 [Homalodisca vitripennis]
MDHKNLVRRPHNSLPNSQTKRRQGLLVTTRNLEVLGTVSPTGPSQKEGGGSSRSPGDSTEYKLSKDKTIKRVKSSRVRVLPAAKRCQIKVPDIEAIGCQKPGVPAGQRTLPESERFERLEHVMGRGLPETRVCKRPGPFREMVIL